MTMRYAHLARAHNLAAVERLVHGNSGALPGDASANTSATGHSEPPSDGSEVVH